MAGITSFHIDSMTRSHIDQLAELSTEGNRSKWLVDFVSQFKDDYIELVKVTNQTLEGVVHVRAVRRHASNMSNGKVRIRNWDGEVMAILRHGRALGMQNDPENIALYDQMIDRLIDQLQAAKADNWATPEGFSL
jgi:hypothetical protein